MAEMGAYCKAYYVKKLREFPHWKEHTQNLRKAKKQVDGKEIVVERNALVENDIVYIHENYYVADGVFKDENIIFDSVTDEWKGYCHDVLGFKIPVRESAAARA